MTQDSTSAVAVGAVKHAQKSAQNLSRPLVVNASDDLANISNTLSNQQNIITSFVALMKKVEVLVKVGDEVAKVCFSVFSPLLHELNLFFFKKIHPYVNFAWQVLSAGMKVIRRCLFWSSSVIYVCWIRWYKPNKLKTNEF
jgi:hypothetical protein